MYGEDEESKVGKPEGKRPLHMREVGVDGRITLKLIIEK
jgi:hypothetical protein